MVCEKCEAKLKRVITPDVMKQPLYKLPKGAQEEEKVSSKSGVGGFTKSSISSTMIGKDIQGDAPTVFGSDKRTLSGMNQVLNKSKYKFDPTATTCRICKKSKVQPGHYYCQHCSYVKGICSMCGKKIIDTKMYKQTVA